MGHVWDSLALAQDRKVLDAPNLHKLLYSQVSHSYVHRTVSNTITLFSFRFVQWYVIESTIWVVVGGRGYLYNSILLS